VNPPPPGEGHGGGAGHNRLHRELQKAFGPRIERVMGAKGGLLAVIDRVDARRTALRAAVRDHPGGPHRPPHPAGPWPSRAASPLADAATYYDAAPQEGCPPRCRGWPCLPPPPTGGTGRAAGPCGGGCMALRRSSAKGAEPGRRRAPHARISWPEFRRCHYTRLRRAGGASSPARSAAAASRASRDTGAGTSCAAAS